jgi:iron(III) transport system permease protein
VSQPQVRPLEPRLVGGVARLARLTRLGRAHILIALLLAAVAFLVLYPIGTVVLLTFLPSDLSSVFGTIPWYRAFEEPGMTQSVLNTVYVVTAVQLVSMPIAVIISWLLARTDIPGNRAFEFCFWIMFFLPAMGVMTGWLLLFDPDFGLVNEWLIGWGLAKTAPFNLYSFWGIVFVHLTTYGISVKVMLLTPAFRNLDGAIEEASRICGAGRMQTLWRIVLPILMPAMLVVLLMSIIRGLETFEIELILGTPIKFQVYSTKIYLLMANSPPEFRAAGTLATSVLAMVLPLIVLQRWTSTRRSYAVIGGRSTTAHVRLGAWRWPLFGLLLASVVFMSLLPFLLLVAGSFMKLFGFFDLPQVWTIDHWVKALGDVTFTASLRNMLYLGFGTGFLSVAIYALVAYSVVRVRSRLAGPLDMLSWLPLTVPGIVLGFGYLNMAVQVPLFAFFYGTIGALILVSFLAAMPLGVQVLKVHMLQMGGEIEEAGRIVGGSWLRTFRRIVLPLSAPALAVVGVMVFAGTIRSVSSIMLLSTGDNRVLSVLQVEFLSDGSLGPAAVVGTVIVLISVAAAALVRLVSLRFGVQTR